MEEKKRREITRLNGIYNMRLHEMNEILTIKRTHARKNRLHT